MGTKNIEVKEGLGKCMNMPECKPHHSDTEVALALMEIVAKVATKTK